MKYDTKIKMQFDPNIAEELGVDCAIMFANIEFWVDTNKRNGINMFNDKYWTFNSIRAFREQFPFWTEQNIKTILKKLVEAKYIEKGRFNKKGYDKTSWYTVVPAPILSAGALEESSVFKSGFQPIHKLELTNPLVDSNQPIPDTKHQILNTDKEDISSLNTITLNPAQGKTPVSRLQSLYGKLFSHLYGFKPKPTTYPQTGKVFKDLLGSYTEIQIACLLIVFFNWQGMTDKEQSEKDWLVKNAHSIFQFRGGLNKYEAYTRNVAGWGEEFDNDSKLYDIVRKKIAQLSTAS